MNTDDLVLALDRARGRLALIDSYKKIIHKTFDLCILIARDREEIAKIEALRAFTFATLETRLRAAGAG